MFKRLAIALTLAAQWAATTVSAEPRVAVLAQFDWIPEIANFGGLSALEVNGAGTHFTTVSDTGVLYNGAFVRGRKGALINAKLLNTVELVFEHGKRPDKKPDRDTEGMAISAAHGVYISAESNTRLLQYKTDASQPQITHLPPLGAQAPANMGYEALAIAPDGQLVTLPERTPSIHAPFDLQQLDANGEWQVIYRLPRHGGFRPVGADFAPDGHLYVLLRAFNGFAFAPRIERILYKDDHPVGHETIFRGQFGRFDNLEGLATWQAGPNDLRLYAISDDNFSAAQSTEIVEFQIQD